MEQLMSRRLGEVPFYTGHQHIVMRMWEVRIPVSHHSKSPSQCKTPAARRTRQPDAMYTTLDDLSPLFCFVLSFLLLPTKAHAETLPKRPSVCPASTEDWGPDALSPANLSERIKTWIGQIPTDTPLSKCKWDSQPTVSENGISTFPAPVSGRREIVAAMDTFDSYARCMVESTIPMSQVYGRHYTVHY
ncbi:hypothetical protein F4678DRAFT_153366 [Xylaria arbuscula]|nr:hypothetical protein F4678DRAFT_153366 [Xylaria arbuscula]